MVLVHPAFVSLQCPPGSQATLPPYAKRESANSQSQKMDRRSFVNKGLLSVAPVIIRPARMSAESEHKEQGFFTRKYKELFAKALEYTMPEYEAGVASRKKELFSRIRASDTVVDIGMGTGPNLKYMPKGVRVVGVEPNRYMWPYASQKAGIYDINVSFLDGVAESLPLEDNSCDFVITTLTLCSVRDLSRALQEILRVLKPGGQHLFMEHVVASKDRPTLRGAQNLLNPLQVSFADGCHLNRDTGTYIEKAGNPGYSEIHFEEFDALTDTFLDNINPARPHIVGFAQKASL